MAWTRGLVTGWIVAAVFLSGCLGSSPFLDEQEWEPVEEAAYEVIVESRSFEGSAGPAEIHLEPTRVSPEWRFSLAEGSESLELLFTWTDRFNDYTFVLERPDGVEQHELEPGDPSGIDMDETFEWTREIKTPAEGQYTAYVTAQRVYLEDEFQLHATWESVVAMDVDGATLQGSVVQVTQQGGAWRADIVYRGSGEVASPLTLDLRTFNGHVEVVATDGDEATARVQPWARAATQERAEELVRSVEVSIKIRGDQMRVLAERAETHTASGESVGALVKLEVPSTIQGSIRTSNAQVDLEDLTVSDLDVRTSNGGIDAALETSGELTLRTSNNHINADIKGDGGVGLRTSNGPVDLTFEPTADTDLNVRSSNNHMTLRLKESDSMGYELPSRTSNGAISESMDEASLDGDEKRATLRTSGFSDRTIQVTGEIRTSNGDIAFIGE